MVTQQSRYSISCTHIKRKNKNHKKTKKVLKKQIKDNIFSIIIHRWEKEVSSSLESYENAPSKEKYASATLTALSVYITVIFIRR